MRAIESLGRALPDINQMETLNQNQQKINLVSEEMRGNMALEREKFYQTKAITDIEINKAKMQQEQEKRIEKFKQENSINYLKPEKIFPLNADPLEIKLQIAEMFR